MRLFVTAWLVAGLAVAWHHEQAAAQPLSTSSRWIVDEGGRRVKLACVNWPSHLEPMLAEGLSKRALADIAGDVRTMGFNCVRLTWPTFLVTNVSYASLTVAESFRRLNLAASLAGVEANNPGIVQLKLVDALRAVVRSLGEAGVMVILDNHVNKPGWCCDEDDGNGFFGDAFFDPEVWVDGLSKMAAMFAGERNVVGMSLRNELRGPRQNTDDWYRYMQRGAEAVHAANPGVLVILSVLKFDNDLAFIRWRPAKLSFAQKVAFEVHWYSYSDPRQNTLLFIAIILDPRCKLKYLSFTFSNIYDSVKAKEFTDRIERDVHSLFECYVKSYASASCHSNGSQPPLLIDVDEHVDDPSMLLASQFSMHLEEIETRESNSELSRYLAENCEKMSDKFDLLGWWKCNSNKYPILSTLAKDILAVPVSTVASESAFSTGGRVIDSFRTSLSANMVEALICTQSWLRSPSGIVDIRKAIEELQVYEDIEQELLAKDLEA